MPRRLNTPDELKAHIAGGDGFIFNVDGKKLHAVTCDWVRGMGLGTSKYALDADEDVATFLATRGGSACPTCLPGVAGGRARLGAARRPVRASATTTSLDMGEFASGQAPRESAGSVEFAVVGRKVLAWSSEYVPLSPKTPTAVALKAGLVFALARLAAEEGEILHAVFAGHKPATADIENLLLYNLGSAAFTAAAAHGLLIERDLGSPRRSLSGAEYPYLFAYEIASAEAPWALWMRGAELVRFSQLSLGAFAGEKKLEQVWATLCAADLASSAQPRSVGEHYAVMIELHPPVGSTAHPARLIKSVVDGVVSAFQAHTGREHRAEVARRIARSLDETPERIEGWLADERCAVLGSVQSIVHIRGEGVQWSPADTDLVVADVRPAPPIGEHWAISGSVHIASRAVGLA